MKDLIFLFKLKNGLYNLDCEEYAENVQTNLNLVIIVKNFSSGFSELRYRTNYFGYSYFPRVIRSWNSLPPALKTITRISTFKTALKELNSLRLVDSIVTFNLVELI
jgi:hypothetical protein